MKPSLPEFAQMRAGGLEGRARTRTRFEEPEHFLLSGRISPSCKFRVYEIMDGMTAKIRRVRIGDERELAQMRALLWPDASAEEHLREAEAALAAGAAGNLPNTILVSLGEGETLSGFLEVGLRSHADGCDTRHSVGFVEGWFVRQPFRGMGIGRDLMKAAEDWARAQGCLEMGSDALIDNEESHRAHCALGFEVVDRCVHFKKSL
jgi:aminoglycoside 6'-N-acetyltransferase I